MHQNEVPYNTVPHYIASDYRSRKLKLNELLVLMWLRAIGNPYGIATTSLDDLRADILPHIKKNTVNTILLALRQKQYIFYEPRQGKSGSFDVHLNHWKMPKKRYKTLDKFFSNPRQWDGEQFEPANEAIYPQTKSPEVTQKSEVLNQKLNEQRGQLINKVSVNSGSRHIRSYHHEHDTEKQNENHDTLGNYEGGTLVSAFEPTTYEEQRCAEIAREVGDKYINPLLAVLRKDGFRIIERAWGLYREDKQSGKRIGKPAAYFYGIIKKLRNQP